MLELCASYKKQRFKHYLGSTDLKNLKIEVLKTDPDIKGIVNRYFSVDDVAIRTSRRWGCSFSDFFLFVSEF